jgi:5-methylcytosine-specific restriction protein A
MPWKAPIHKPPGGKAKQRSITDAQRPSAAARGYGWQWGKLRKLVLVRQPLCQSPGCFNAATDVDHIIPKAKGGTDALENLQALCKPCHSRKTARRDGGFGH